MKIRWYENNKPCEIEISPDQNCVAVELPKQDECPAITVHVNSDMVQIDSFGHSLGALTYTDLVGEAAAENCTE